MFQYSHEKSCILSVGMMEPVLNAVVTILQRLWLVNYCAPNLSFVQGRSQILSVKCHLIHVDEIHKMFKATHRIRTLFLSFKVRSHWSKMILFCLFGLFTISLCTPKTCLDTYLDLLPRGSVTLSCLMK